MNPFDLMWDQAPIILIQGSVTRSRSTSHNCIKMSYFLMKFYDSRSRISSILQWIFSGAMLMDTVLWITDSFFICVWLMAFVNLYLLEDIDQTNRAGNVLLGEGRDGGGRGGGGVRGLVNSNCSILNHQSAKNLCLHYWVLTCFICMHHSIAKVSFQ